MVCSNDNQADASYFSDANRQRFESFVDIGGPDECWEWRGGKTSDGYGIFWICGTKKTAHRYAKETQLGQQLPRKLDGSHSCDNRSCCNPRHILVETRTENMARMPEERRIRALGRKLTDAQADAIRKSGFSNREEATRYGVSYDVIYRLRRGHCYRVTGPRPTAA